MPNFITIKDGNAVDTKLHTIEDSTSTHFNQSIPTDSAGNVATVVSGSQAVAAAMGALVVAQRDGLPAGTNIIGKVSTAGIVSVWDANTVVPDTDAKVLQGFQHSVNIAAGYVYNRASNTWDRMTGTSVGLAVTQAGAWSVSVNDRVSVATVGTPVDGFGAVQNLFVAAQGMVRNRNSNTWDMLTGTSLGMNVVQSGTWGVNINGAVVSTNNLNTINAVNGSLYTIGMNYAWDGSVWRIVSSDTSGRLNVNANVSLGGSTALVGSVSISPNGLNIPVSIAPPTFNIPVSLAPPALNFPVSIANIANVSVTGTLKAQLWDLANGVAVALGADNADALATSGTANRLKALAMNAVFNRNSSTWDLMTGTSLGLNVVANNVSLGGSTALIGSVSISPNGLNLPVSVASGRVSVNGMVTVMPAANFAAALPAGGFAVGGEVSTGNPTFSSGVLAPLQLDANGRLKISGTITGGSMTQTVGAAVTTEGYPMLGSDGSLARRLLTTTGGALVVHVSNAQPTPSGISMTQTVGAAVTTEGYPMLGSDGTNARRLLTTTGGALVVHVSNISPGGGGGAGGSTMTQTVGAAVTTEGYPMLGTDGTNARIIKTDTLGRVSLADTFFNVGVNVALPPGTNLIGGVSVRQIVSVQPDGTANWPVSIAPPTFNIPVSIAPPALNFPVSIAPAADKKVIGAVSIADSILGTIGIKAGTAQIGAVSVNQVVSVVPNTNFAAALPAHGFAVGGEVSTGNPTFSSGVLAPLQLDANGRLKISGTITGGSMTQTVGAAVTTEGYPMLGSDGTNARRLLTTTGGALIVHVSNTAPGGGAGGTTQLVSVGGTVSTQGVQVVGTDGTNARTLLTTTGGALIVHVSNTAPGGGAGGGGTITVSVGGAVSTQAVQVAGVDNSGNARTIKTNVSGVQIITTRTFMNQDIFTRPNDVTAYTAGTAAAPGAAGDLIANSTTNTAVKPLKFRVAKGPGEVCYIRGARLYRTGGTAATGQHAITGALRLHLFNTNNEVSVATGDNAAMLASPVSLWLGYIDLTPIASAPGLRTGAGTSVQVYWGAPARTGEMIVPLSANQVSIQGLLECKVAFTPIANEIFTVQLDGFLG